MKNNEGMDSRVRSTLFLKCTLVISDRKRSDWKNFARFIKYKYLFLSFILGKSMECC